MSDLSGIIEKIPHSTILVVGDIMLDTFVYGSVSRISPESPIPVLSIARDNRMLGGAGNVLSNLSGLGAKTHIISVVGEDEYGGIVKGIAETMGADADTILSDPGRPTTLKTRYLARNQQLLRTDLEKTHKLDQDMEDKLIEKAGRALDDVQAVILSDYGKGVLTERIISTVIDQARKRSIPVLVDPKGQDYSLYKGAAVVTPNRNELSGATGGLPTKEDAHVVKAAETLIDQSGIAAVVATRSEDGMTIVQQSEDGTGFRQPTHLKTRAREVYDVSGAGDTVIATIAAALAAGASLVESAALANVAGGIVVAKVGTTPIRASELIEAQDREEYSLQTNPVGDMATIDRTRQARILNWDDATQQVQKWRARGLKVGFTNGCFDILHYGHINYLNQARNKCDRLVLGLNHDQSVRLLKGPERPVNDELARATVIGALGSIDMVVLFGAEKDGEDNTPCALISKLQPDIFFKGGDYTIDQLPEAGIVQSYGGEVSIMSLFEGYSTTSTIEKMKEEAA